MINDCKCLDFDEERKNDNLKENDHGSVVSQCYNMHNIQNHSEQVKIIKKNK